MHLLRKKMVILSRRYRSAGAAHDTRMKCLLLQALLQADLRASPVPLGVHWTDLTQILSQASPTPPQHSLSASLRGRSMGLDRLAPRARPWFAAHSPMEILLLAGLQGSDPLWLISLLMNQCMLMEFLDT